MTAKLLPTFAALAAICLAVTAAAAAHEDMILSQQRMHSGWEEVAEAPEASHPMSFIIYLHIKDPEGLEEAFWAVSTPSSPRWRQHLTHEEVRELTAVDDDVMAAVQTWAESTGAKTSAVRTGDALMVHGTVQQVEQLVGARVGLFRNPTMDMRRKKPVVVPRILSHTPATVPAAVAQYIATFDGLADFPPLRMGSQRGELKPLRSDIFVDEAKLTQYAEQAELHDMLTGVTDDDELSDKMRSIKPAAMAAMAAAGMPDGAVPGPAPSVLQVATGDQQMALIFVPSCYNGTVSAQACNDPITNFTFVVQSRGGEPFETVTQYDDGCQPGEGYTLCFGTTPFSTKLINYVPTSASVVVTYASGNMSAPLVFPNIVLGRYTLPRELRDAYNVPTGLTVQTGVRAAVAEWQDSYSPLDLDIFLDLVGLPPVTVANQSTAPNDPSQPGGEATLDIQYLLGVAPGIEAFFEEEALPSDPNNPAFFALWLTALNNLPDNQLPHIISVSYGEPEYLLGATAVHRYDQEFMKQGTRGCSIIFASGDNGVSGEADEACKPLHPGYPGASPYVTAVGATMWSTQSLPMCSQTALGQSLSCTTMGEIVCQTDRGALITSGGGFSLYNAMPPYQEHAVTGWMSVPSNVPEGGNGSYWFAGNRGFPDVAANGHSYVTVTGQKLGTVDGTSASTPTFAGIMALVTDALFRAKQPAIGFLNPWLYDTARKHPSAFNDITLGDNACQESLQCCPIHFKATVGWDPVTGLGTPNFEVLRAAALMPDATFLPQKQLNSMLCSADKQEDGATLDPAQQERARVDDVATDAAASDKNKCPTCPPNTALWVAVIILLALSVFMTCYTGVLWVRLSRLDHDTGVAFKSMED